MQYEIKGGSFPVVECKLEDGEKMITKHFPVRTFFRIFILQTERD